MESKALRAVGYRRVSMREQVDGFSLAAQENNIKQYVASQGWHLLELYTDAGISAKKDSHRPAMEQLMSDAQVNAFDVVVVDKVDRFYRHLRGLLGALDQLNSSNISFVSVQERLDFTTVWGKLMLTVLGTLAEIYIDNLRQETKKGKLQRARDGLWNGNIPYGYCRGLCSKCKEPNGEGYCPAFGGADRGDGKYLVAHPIESRVVRLAYDWYLTGVESDGLIAARLQTHTLDENGLLARTHGVPNQAEAGGMQKDSVRAILTNVFYAGVICYHSEGKEEFFPGKHPALVSKEEFERVQEMRKLLGRTPRHHRPQQARVYPLSGVLYCGHCGRRMRGSSGPRNRHYYRDTTNIERVGQCQQKYVQAERAEAQVVKWLQSVLEHVPRKQEKNHDEEQLKRLKARYTRARRLFILGEVDQETYEAEKRKYELFTAPLQENSSSANITSHREMKDRLSKWQQLTNLEKRRLLQGSAEAVYILESVLVGVQPTISLFSLIQASNPGRVGNCGPDGHGTRS
jgi:site-specific DNA recombinase